MCLCVCVQTNWTESGRCLREVGVELQDDAQCEAQRRVVQVAFLSLLLPTPVLHILTQGRPSAARLESYSSSHRVGIQLQD